ncbi:MAG TPA: glutamine--fructose-6-phosphate transaminase (isomerizing) [Acidimicrobiales bacterium]|jgi:glucosamine--fructose-6-phosphate aminotransferase (isomerizing)
MCGIVGYVGSRPASPLLIEGLARLEYRGYDSAGLAVVGASKMRVWKAVGRVRDLQATLPKRIAATTGIAHTRWATHGAPSHVNAHPQVDGSNRIAVVHNGIIENANELRAKLEAEDVVFTSETDTEVLTHLIVRAIDDGHEELEEAVRQALSVVSGTYGIAVVDARHPDRIVSAANGSPVVLGIGEREMFVASDASALIRYTRQIVRLDDGELALVRADGFQTFTLDAVRTEKQSSWLEHDELASYERDEHEHFMHKEIHDQPQALARTLRGRVNERFATAHLGGLNLDARQARAFQRVKILGCGSAYYAGQIGASLIEELARVPADAEPASEFRYRNAVIEPTTLYVAVSQSGETADTLRAVQEVRRKGGFALGVVNVVGSAIARECDGGIYLHAGPEVSVAATKSFTCTAAALALLALYLGRIHDLSPAEGTRITGALLQLPEQLTETLRCEEQVARLAARYASHDSMLFIGRVRGWPVAREGAQKLKEVSYVHAEAYQASELKHGPLALIGPDVPTVAIVGDDELFEKNLATLAEIKARRGPVLAVTHRPIPAELADDVISIPRSERELDGILLGIPLQLLAYYAAIERGNEVDRPRNLAKSVTVE